MKDKIITCIQCETEFVVTVAEQLRLAARGFGRPKRCPECRKKKDKAIEMNNLGKNKGKRGRGWRKEERDKFFEA
jgi:hypothetical protein